MTDKLEKALAEEFPFMQADPDATFWYGVEFGDGWYPLLREMCGEIDTTCKAADGPVDIVVEQNKREVWTAVCPLPFCNPFGRGYH